jgi:hypothetical protein
VKRDEIGATVLSALVVTAFVVILASGLADVLGGLGWFSNGSNVIQWISGPATLAAVATALWMRWSRTCAVPYCLRFGEHPVAGTLKKVCTHHHTLHHHLVVHNLHHDAHIAAGRLGWGESHGRST